MQIKLLSPDAKLPRRAHPTDAGLDLFSCEDYNLLAGRNYKFNVQVAVAIPPGFVGLICDKSGIGDKLIKVFGGVIDSGYTGPIMVRMCNFGLKDWVIKKGNAIAQMIVIPCDLFDCEVVDTLPKSERGDKGFGSTQERKQNDGS